MRGENRKAYVDFHGSHRWLKPHLQTPNMVYTKFFGIRMQKRKNDHKFVYPNSPLPACLPAIRHNAVAPFACITIEMVRCSVHRDDEMKEKPKVNRNYSNDKNLNAVYMKFINIKRFVSFIRCSNGHGNAFAQRHRPLQLCAVCWSISWCALRCEKKI